MEPKTKSFIVAAALTAATLPTSAQTEIQQLEARLAKLEANQKSATQNINREEIYNQLTHQIINDINTRSSHLAAGNAGHNGKFFLQSEDGSNLLNIKGHIQTRYIINFRDNPSSNDDTNAGFQLRRAKIKLAGKINNVTYKTSLAANRGSGNIDLEEFALKLKLNKNFTFVIGKDKLPFNLEAQTSSSKQVAVERSRVNAIFEPARGEGINLNFQNENFKTSLALSDGAKSGESSTNKDFQNNTADIAISGRATYKALGNWKQFADQSAWSGQGESLFFGAGFHYQDTNPNAVAAPFNQGNSISYTIDAAYKYNSLSLTVAFYSQHIYNQAVGQADLTHYGSTAQAAYFIIPDEKEIFLRFESYDIQNAGNNVLWTAGFNIYQKKHAAKFSADVVWAVQPLSSLSDGQPLGSSSVSAGHGLLTDNSQDNQTAIRLQYQLLF